MAVNRNQPVRFLFIVILIVRASTDYFAGLPLDQKLIDNANIALDRLKHKLQQEFDCSEDKQNHSGLQNHEGKAPSSLSGINLMLSSVGKHSQRTQQQDKDQSELSIQQCQLKKNRDRTMFEFRLPTLKKVIGSTLTYFDRLELQKRLKAVSEYLGKIKEHLVQYNNVIIGENNKIDGNNNVVIGSRNSLTGNNYWVFDSDINSHANEDGVLIIQNYLIQLTDIPDILTRPRQVIRCIKQKESDHRFKVWWQSAKPHSKMCF